MASDIFFVKALIAGVGLALFVSVLGCFVVWQRMSYFGESLAHSSFLGVAMGISLGLGSNIGVIIICFLFAIILVFLQQKKIFSNDALMGILSHSALAMGVVVLSFMGKTEPQHIHEDLFGGIFNITTVEIMWIYGVGSVVMTMLIFYWPSLVLFSISEELACTEGVPIFFMRLLLMFLMTTTVAVSLQVVGILSITALLIIPAATARLFSRSPEFMAVLSCIIGIISIVGGIIFSYFFEKMSGPSIVLFSSFIFFLALIFRNVYFFFPLKK